MTNTLNKTLIKRGRILKNWLARDTCQYLAVIHAITALYLRLRSIWYDKTTAIFVPVIGHIYLTTFP